MRIATLWYCLAAHASLLTVVVPAEAQTAPGAQSARLEVAATVSGAQPRVAVVSCCQLRTPPRYSVTDRSFSAVVVGAKLRLLWGSRGSRSTGVDIAWTVPTRRAFSYPAPSSIPPPIAPIFFPSAVVGRATERKGWTLSASHGGDFVVRNRWRASLAAEILLDRVEERYEQTSLVYSDPPRIGKDYFSARTETLAAGAVTAGLKFYVAPRVFMTAEASFRQYFRHASLDRSRSSLRVGFGFKLGPE